MNRIARFFGVFAVVVIGFTMPAFGQDVFDPSDSWVDENDPRYYENVFDQNLELIGQERWADIFKKLSDQAEASDVDWSGADEVRQRLIEALDSTIAEISMYDAQYNSDYLNRSNPLNTGRFAEGTLGQGFVGFNGMRPPIVLCMEGAEMAAPCNEAMHPVLTEEQAEDIRYRANAANELLVLLRGDADDAIIEAIDTSYRRWVNFLDNGFVMFPWEIGLNSALLNWDIRTPPSTQFIFLHPSLGVQIPLDGLSDPVKFRAKESLVIEVAGHLWYRGQFLDNYSGVSGTVVLREDLPPGLGFLVRPARGFSVGLNWHFSANEQKQFIKTPYLTVSVNVLNLIKSNRGLFEF